MLCHSRGFGGSTKLRYTEEIHSEKAERIVKIRCEKGYGLEWKRSGGSNPSFSARLELPWRKVSAQKLYAYFLVAIFGNHRFCVVAVLFYLPLLTRPLGNK